MQQYSGTTECVTLGPSRGRKVLLQRERRWREDLLRCKVAQAGIIVLLGIRDAPAVVSGRFGVFGSLIDSFNECAESLLCLSGEKTPL